MDDKTAQKLTAALDSHTEALKAHTKALDESNRLTQRILGIKAQPRPVRPDPVPGGGAMPDLLGPYLNQGSHQ